jgi:hypothetical protein
MNKQDAKPFFQLLDAWGEGQDKTVSAARKTLFFDSLAAYDLDVVRGALATFLRSPAAKYGKLEPAHLIEIIEGTEEERDAHAWATLVTGFRRLGSYVSVIVEDLALARAVERKWGSWAAACESWGTSNEFLWQQQRKDFLGLYKLARRTVFDEPPVMLPGRASIENANAQWFPSRAVYGVIFLDGRCETRYLTLDQRTGLPASTDYRAVLALPKPHPQGLLPAPVDDEVITPDPDRARAVLKQIFEEWLQTMPTFPARRPVEERIPGLTPEEEERRKAIIRRQAHDAENERRPESAIRTQTQANSRRPDRSADHGGEAAGVRKGTQVSPDQKLAIRSGVAGMENRLRDRGGRVRERDPRRAGRMDDAAQEEPGNRRGRKPSSRTRSSKADSHRRKA